MTLNRVLSWVTGAAVTLLAIAMIWVEREDRRSHMDNGETSAPTEARDLYLKHCASCHGRDLEGEVDWQRRLPDGRMPAPPHDATGHTWHHPDRVLFGIVKEGPVPGKFAPPGHVSNMPAFAGVLTDEEIWAVLDYIKNTWPERERRYQQDVDRKDRTRD